MKALASASALQNAGDKYCTEKRPRFGGALLLRRLYMKWFSASISVESRFQRKCNAIDTVTNIFARSIAFSNDKPDARLAMTAAEYVQPVPWVATPRTKGAENSVTSPL